MSSLLALHLPLRHLSTGAASISPKPTTTTKVGLYFHNAQIINTLRLHLRSSPSPSLPSNLPPFITLSLLRSSPLFLSLTPCLSPPLLLSLASRLAISRRLPELHSLLSSIPPLPRLRLLSIAHDLPSALSLFNSLRNPPTEAYNLIINLLVSTGAHSEAVRTFSQLIRDGGMPNSRTYTVVIRHLVRAGFLDAAVGVFGLLPSMRVARTVEQYNVLAEAFSEGGRFDELRGILKEMSCDGVLPGRAVRAAIVRMRDVVGDIRCAEEFESELEPNENIRYVTMEEDDEDDEDDKLDGERSVRLKPWLDVHALVKALEGWDCDEVAELEKAEMVWTSRLVCKFLRAFRKAESAWEFFCWVAYQPGGFMHDRHTVARMITILARGGHVELVERLIVKVKEEGIRLPFATVRMVVDFYGLSKQADAAIKVFGGAESLCGALTSSQRMLLSSSLLRTMIKCRRGNDAMGLLEEMMLDGILPDIQTFSGLMQYFASFGDLKTVHKLFGMVRQCRLEPDTYMYMVLIQAYCKQNRASLALKLFEEMRSSSLAPDRATKALLVNSLWKEGKLREAATVEEKYEATEKDLPRASPGHVWTVSAADFKRIYNLYSGCFCKDSGKQ